LDTIRVCPGTYTEQLVITKRLRIVSTAGAALTTIVNPNPGWTPSTCNPAPPGIIENYDVVDVCGGVYVFMRGLTIQGNFTSPSNVGDCAHGVFGVAVMGGATLVMLDSVVTGASPGPSLFGCQTGLGVVAGRYTTSQVGTVTLRGVTVNGYAKGGVVAQNYGSKANVFRSTITGAGPTPLVAQNGVQISRGAAGTVRYSTISGHECDHPTCGPDYLTQTSSTGVLVFDPGARVGILNNTITDNDQGGFSCGESCLGFTSVGPANMVNFQRNTLTNNRFRGLAFDQGPSRSAGNTISGSNQGIVIGATTTQTAPATASILFNNSFGNFADVAVMSDGPAHPVPTLNVRDNVLLSPTAILNGTTDQIRAPGNWYGDVSGPSGWSFGSGSSVSAFVNFWPWATGATVPVTRVLPRRECDRTGPGTFNDSGQIVWCGRLLPDTITETGTADVLFVGGNGADVFTGGSGTSYVIDSPGPDTFTGGPGLNDHIQCRSTGDTIVDFEIQAGCS
jgi:hypothetical protein